MEIYPREDWRELKPHEAAEVFPLMAAAELEGMIEDMKAHGFDRSYPVALKDGLVLDGRNRLAACREAGATPWFFDYGGEDVTAFVVRANLQRRQLTDSQNAVVAAKLLPLFAAEAKAAQRRSGGDQKSEAAKSVRVDLREPISQPSEYERRASTQAARPFGISGSMVERAVRIQKQAPDLFKEVEEGKRTVNGALGVMKRREGMETVREKPKPIAKQKRPRERDLQGWEALIEGKMEAYLDVAYALLEIREKRLFLEGHGEFKRYLRERWGIPFTRLAQVTLGIDAVMVCGTQQEEGQ